MMLERALFSIGAACILGMTGCLADGAPTKVPTSVCQGLACLVEAPSNDLNGTYHDCTLDVWYIDVPEGAYGQPENVSTSDQSRLRRIGYTLAVANVYACAALSLGADEFADISIAFVGLMIEDPMLMGDASVWNAAYCLEVFAEDSRLVEILRSFGMPVIQATISSTRTPISVDDTIDASSSSVAYRFVAVDDGPAATILDVHDREYFLDDGGHWHGFETVGDEIYTDALPAHVEAAGGFLGRAIGERGNTYAEANMKRMPGGAVAFRTL